MTGFDWTLRDVFKFLSDRPTFRLLGTSILNLFFLLGSICSMKLTEFKTLWMYGYNPLDEDSWDELLDTIEFL